MGARHRPILATEDLGKDTDMKPKLSLLALIAALGLAACVTQEEETYPITGEECGPEDPVKDFGPSDCVLPTGSGVGTM